MTALKPMISRPGDQSFDGPPEEQGKIRLSAADTGGAFTLFEVVSEPNIGPPYHVHTLEDEIFMLHEGQIEFTVGGEKILAGPGDRVFAPRGVPHKYVSLTKTRMEAITTGDNFERFYPLYSGALLAGNLERAAEIAAEHGITFIDE